LSHVKKQTVPICFAAVSADGDALKFVRKQTPELCLLAVRNRGPSLEHVWKQTPDICAAALAQDEEAVMDVNIPLEISLRSFLGMIK
jgi:hypothetical protein